MQVPKGVAQDHLPTQIVVGSVTLMVAWQDITAMPEEQSAGSSTNLLELQASAPPLDQQALASLPPPPHELALSGGTSARVFEQDLDADGTPPLCKVKECEIYDAMLRGDPIPDLNVGVDPKRNLTPLLVTFNVCHFWLQWVWALAIIIPFHFQ